MKFLTRLTKAPFHAKHPKRSSSDISRGAEGIGKRKDVLPALGAHVDFRGENGLPHGGGELFHHVIARAEAPVTGRARNS